MEMRCELVAGGFIDARVGKIWVWNEHQHVNNSVNLCRAPFSEPG